MNVEKEERYENEYVGYEYREIAVPAELTSLCMDSYPCFGWERDPHRDSLRRKHLLAEGVDVAQGNTAHLYFRRNRALANRTELTRLQRQFDSCIAELQALERSKTTFPLVAALGIGILGTAFVAGATFAAVAPQPVWWLMVLLAVPGFLGWILPLPVYRALVRRKTAEILPLMEQKYDEIDAVCAKGSSLLH